MKKIKQSNKTVLYTVIVIIVLAIVLLGWYTFSAQAKLITGEKTKCTRWKCTDTLTYTCSSGATSYRCENGLLMCYYCTTTNNTKDYNVTLLAIGNQNVYANYIVSFIAAANQTTGNNTVLTGIYNIKHGNNTYDTSLAQGKSTTLPDGIVFGVTILTPNFTAFYLKSNHETKSSSVSISNQALVTLWVSIEPAAVFTINSESATLSAGQTKMLSDMTIFGVTELYLNYTSFYLQSTYETKSSSLTAPFPKSTTVNLIISQSSGCGAISYSCSNWYLPSCSGNTLTCSLSGYYCSSSSPSPNCARKGSCVC